MAHVRENELVEVTSGKHKGSRGKIKEILHKANRVRVEGVALVTRHLPPNRDAKRQEGGRIEKLGSIHISNVSPIDPKTNKPTRVGRRVNDDGKKVRVARRSGEVLQ